jgi:hypothetical protein
MNRLYIGRSVVVAVTIHMVWSNVLVSASAQEATAPSEQSKQAAKKEVDPSGTWKWEREFGDNIMRSTLKLKKGDGGKLSGTLQTIFGDGGGPGSDPVKIDHGKIDGESVTFSVTRNFNGNEFTIEYKGTYANGELNGSYTLDFGQGPREREWTAKRHLGHDDVVGEWHLSFESRNGQIIESIATVKLDDEEKLAGTYHSGFFGDAPMKNVAVKDGTLSWEVVLDTDNGDFALSYSGKPASNSMKGTIKSAVGGQENETPFTAKLEQIAADKRSDDAKPADAATSRD